ncbi:hypothetical protein MOX02_55210 [Methylobacterium oxalidis]|uniref:Uncharacterized protein n=1 Tax=Methylobacterium oxalidis TaxID=944322 RepID=A0A512JBZ9_9HYPH|nr:hypothetical protein MOX02_55210 [Methylobacterium oxalidis]GJE35441.1 hypothetical protein LDDCCGHA_5659 [Methylobacterium oxalidis]GLS66048.1 hypothetical protein GCM10007888_44300 [Methylobacterium oxalidis]
MAFFLGIGGPWIVLMILDLFWTKQSLELSHSERSRGWQQRLERLLQRREGRPVPIPVREPLSRSEHGDELLSRSESYLFRQPA